MTGKTKRARRSPRRRKSSSRDAALDEALEETFPASDPVEMTQPKRRNGPADRPRRR